MKRQKRVRQAYLTAAEEKRVHQAYLAAAEEMARLVERVIIEIEQMTDPEQRAAAEPWLRACKEWLAGHEAARRRSSPAVFRAGTDPAA